MLNPNDPLNESKSLDALKMRAEEVAAIAIRCLTECLPLDSQLGALPDCIYIKSSDLKIVYANESYRNVFSTDSLPIGRSADSILHGSVLSVSKASDQMILAGSPLVIFEHFGQDATGRFVQFRTLKRSLQGEGHVAVAILGISCVQTILDDPLDNRTKLAVLVDRWNRFQSMDAADREIAIEFARGATSSKIALQRDVSKRSIEYRRNAIHAALEVESQVELAKLLVRFEEKGFCELGLG